MAKLELDIESTLPPQRIIDALTDFTEKRPDIWPGLSRELYEVYEVGDTTAEVREGTSAPGMKVWARERYDWSEPNVVKWTVLESNFSKPGGGLVTTVTPRNGGSHVHISWERSPSTFMGRVALGMMVLSRGRPITASFKKGLKKIEEADPGLR